MVGNLTRNVTEVHIKEIFAHYGPIKSVDLAIDRQVNLPKGFAHIEFEARDDAEKAMDYMNGAQIDGNVVRWVWRGTRGGSERAHGGEGGERAHTTGGV